MEVLWEAEKLMVKALVEALVIVPVVEFKVVIVPLVDQKLVPVRLVDEALVKVAVVENRVGAVRMGGEEVTKLVFPATLKFSSPFKYFT